MTKIGEGKRPPEEPSYHHELDTHAIKFLKALDEYNIGNEEQKSHAQSVMDHCLAMIRSAVPEIHRSGISKQLKVVQADYEAYIKRSSSENFSRLQEDLATLRDYNKI